MDPEDESFDRPPSGGHWGAGAAESCGRWPPPAMHGSSGESSGRLALLLGVYCLLAAATALYAAPGQPDPAELAARERYQWPGWIPVVFLAIVVIYAVTVAARRRRRARGQPSAALHAGPAPRSRPSAAGTATPGHADDSLSGTAPQARSADASGERFLSSTSAVTKTSTMTVSSPSSSMA